jgi:hypothetical protein
MVVDGLIAVEKKALCFVVRDHKLPCMAHFYFDEDLDNHSATKLLIPHRASRIAPDLAKLPELLRMAWA